MVYLYDDGENLNSLKIAYVVSKKVSLKAVMRNKIKRRMRMAVCNALRGKEAQEWELKKNIWLALIASKKASEASFQQISSEIKQSLQKLI